MDAGVSKAFFLESIAPAFIAYIDKIKEGKYEF